MTGVRTHHACVRQVDNRPLPPVKAHLFESAGRGGGTRGLREWWPLDAAQATAWNQLTQLINLAYAKRHGYTFLRAQYHRSLIAGRAYLWSKVLIMWRVALAHSHCRVVAFIDSDATFETQAPLRPLLQRAGLLRPSWEERVRAGNAPLPPRRLFLLPKEPPGSNAFKDFRGNDITNTEMSTGFIAFRNSAAARRMLLEWWWAPQQLPSMRRYLVQWAHEQRVWNDVMRPKYRDAWIELPKRPDVEPPLLSTPQGSFVRHMWWKDNTSWAAELKERVAATFGHGTSIPLPPTVPASSAAIAPHAAAPAVSLAACSYPLLLRAEETTVPARAAGVGTAGAAGLGRRLRAGGGGQHGSARGGGGGGLDDCNGFSLLRGHKLGNTGCAIPAMQEYACAVQRVPSVGKCCQVSSQRECVGRQAGRCEVARAAGGGALQCAPPLLDAT